MRNKDINDLAYAIVTETTRAMDVTRGMIEDAEIAARAALKSRRFTNCRNLPSRVRKFYYRKPLRYLMMR